MGWRKQKEAWEFSDDASGEDKPKAPFWKKELSFRRKKRASAAVADPKPKRRRRSFGRKPKDERVIPKTPKTARKRSFRRKPKAAPVAKQARKEKKQKRVRSERGLPTRRKRLVGLKIGASQLAAARVVNNGSAEVVQLARTALADGIVVGGEVRDPEQLTLALKDFFRRNKLPRNGVRLGISSNRIGVRTFEIAGIEDPKQLSNAIRFRAQEVLPIPIEEAVLDYQILSERVDEQGVTTRRVLLVVAYRELVDRYVAACRKAGIKLVGIDLEAFAILRALGAPPEEGRAPAALVVVSLGDERSTFAVSDGRVCEFTRVLEWGGSALDVAIARALDLTPSQAEPIKRTLSLADRTTVPEGLSPDHHARAIEAVQHELHSFARELVSSLQFYQGQPGSLGIGEIILTGGTAEMPGFEAELQRLIGVAVRIGDPLAGVKVGKKVRDRTQIGSLAVAIGLGIEAA